VTTMYATFFAQDRFLGVTVDRVQEVLRAQPLTSVPLAHPHVAGLLNLRGSIVTALELRARLGLPRREAHAPSALVVVTTDLGPLALVVDRLGDVLSVDPGAFETLPETVEPTSRRLIKGTYKLDDALLLELDLDETVNLTNDLELV
jgi:purine-binding chemotaxis protein CheW